MSNELLVAVVGLIGSLCGSVIGVFGSAKVLTYRVAELEEKIKMADRRIENLEKRGRKV